MYFPSLLPMLCVPCTIHDVVRLPFWVGSCKKIFSSWALASISPNALWFNKEGSTKSLSVKDSGAGIFRGCLRAGIKAHWLCKQLAYCAACPHQAQVRILQLVPFLTVQGEAVPAAACWLAQGCNPAGGILRAAPSGSGLLAMFTFLPTLETSIL